VELRGLSKSFGTVKANQNINLTLYNAKYWHSWAKGSGKTSR
jgi:ABC-type sugar transport system ATPase subunit